MKDGGWEGRKDEIKSNGMKRGMTEDIVKERTGKTKEGKDFSFPAQKRKKKKIGLNGWRVGRGELWESAKDKD